MAEPLRVTLERGPNGKKVVAIAPDWPGLEREANTWEAAVERLLFYLAPYAKVADWAGMGAEFSGITDAFVVEEYPGKGSTDFWGVSFAFSDFDRQAMSGAALERELALMRTCWAFFDDARSRVSPELRKGPRGGGRDRNRMVRHVVAAELDWAKKVGVRVSPDGVPTDEELTTYRDAHFDDIRAFHVQGKAARSWPLRYLIRHTAFHTLDHAWEMEGRDLATIGA